VIASEKDVVVQLKSRLAQYLGAARFELWFAQRTRLCPTEDGLTIAVEDTFYRDLLRRMFREELNAFCRDAFGESSTIRFSIEPELVANKQVANKQDGSANLNDEPSPSTIGKNRPLTNDSTVDQGGTRLKLAVVDEATQNGAKTTQSVPPRESHLDHPRQSASGGRRRFSRLSGLVEGDSNRLALSTAKNVAEHPGSFTPLVIHGPSGVGKTHLLEGIWCAAREQTRGLHVVYLTSEQFTTLFLGALRGNGLPAFRQKYRGVDVLMIDDVQFLCGKRATLGEFQYTIDKLVREGKQIVLTADRDVSELRGLGREVISRLLSGVSCSIEPPDEAMRLGILLRLASRMKMELPPGVVSLIAKRVQGTAREINGALNRLRATSCAIGQPISEPLARESLAELFRGCRAALGLGDVEKAVCDVFGVDPRALQSERKSKSLSGPRMLAMFLARKHTGAAYSEIGCYFGDRSHSTVMSAKKRIESWVRDGGQLQLYDRPCDVTDALRQVEARMNVG